MSNDANWPPRSFQAVLQAWKPRDSRASLSELDPVLYEPRLKTMQTGRRDRPRQSCRHGSREIRGLR